MADFPKALDFSGRRVLITGGASGIGKETVKSFVGLQASVFVLDKNEEALKKLKEEYPSVTVVTVDLGKWDEARAAVKPLLPIHHLVNNASILIPGSVLEIDEAHVNMYLEINFKQYLNISQVVAQGMIDNKIKGGTIVNISSAGDSCCPQPGSAVVIPMYNCMKASITMLTKVLALELAPYGIRTNAIRPAAVKTEIYEDMTPEVLETFMGAAFNRMVLTKGFLATTDIAKGVVYLSSELSSGTTGTALTIDAGYSMF